MQAPLGEVDEASAAARQRLFSRAAARGELFWLVAPRVLAAPPRGPGPGLGSALSASAARPSLRWRPAAKGGVPCRPSPGWCPVGPAPGGLRARYIQARHIHTRDRSNRPRRRRTGRHFRKSRPSRIQHAEKTPGRPRPPGGDEAEMDQVNRIRVPQSTSNCSYEK